MLYVPVLKCKQGEKDALYTLNEKVKDQITPLIELTPDVIAKGTFCGVEDFWKDRLFIFDVSPEYREELTDEEFLELFGKCNKKQAIAVVRLEDSESKISKLLNSSSNGIALRLYLEEILDDDFESAYEDFLKKFDTQNIDLIIDTQFVESNKVNETSFLIRSALNLINNIKEYRHVIFANNSFPKALDVERYKLNMLPRIESAVYEKVKPYFEKKGVNIVYSDYSINHWSFSEFIPGMQPSFNIRYTTKDFYTIYKGDTVKKGGLNIEKVKAGCAILVASQLYKGKDYSWGDNEIYEKAIGETIKSGNNTTWRAIGTNHHINFIVDHLSNQS